MFPKTASEEAFTTGNCRHFPALSDGFNDGIDFRVLPVGAGITPVKPGVHLAELLGSVLFALIDALGSACLTLVNSLGSPRLTLVDALGSARLTLVNLCVHLAELRRGVSRILVDPCINLPKLFGTVLLG